MIYEDADIVPVIVKAIKRAGVKAYSGWFPARPSYPGVAFYQLGITDTLYAGNTSYAQKQTYCFELRTEKTDDRDRYAAAVAKSLREIYHGRRRQFDDAIDGTHYLKRMTFEFTVKLGG